MFPNKINLTIVICIALCNSKIDAQNDLKAFTEPYRSIEIAAPEMGTISQLFVEEGDRISANTILASLNDEVLAASLEVAQESVNAEGNLNSAIAELKMQTDRFDKIQGLFQRRHASQTEVDRAKTQLEIAQARVESVEDELRIKKMELRRIEAQLEQRRLRAPIDGFVTQIFKDEGEFVSPSDPKVMTVVQLNPLRVIFSVSQDQTHRLKSSQTVPVRIDGRKVDAEIEFVSPTADAQSGTCRVKLKIDNEDLSLTSGKACYLLGFTEPKSEIANTGPRIRSLSTSKTN